MNPLFSLASYRFPPSTYPHLCTYHQQWHRAPPHPLLIALAQVLSSQSTQPDTRPNALALQRTCTSLRAGPGGKNASTRGLLRQSLHAPLTLHVSWELLLGASPLLRGARADRVRFRRASLHLGQQPADHGADICCTPRRAWHHRARASAGRTQQTVGGQRRARACTVPQS